LVKELLELKPKDRISKSKEIFKQFLNPDNIHDIFTEEEAIYYSSLLIKKAKSSEVEIDEN
jgi:hypothetical protein